MTKIASDMSAGCPGVSLPGTSTHDMHAADGRIRRIMVGLPEGPAPAAGFPVVYLLDANACFATMLETMRRGARRPDATGVDAAIIVGIGRPTDALYERAERVDDFTAGPAVRDVEEGKGGLGGGRDADGAGALLDFILATLKPWVEDRYAIDHGRQTLFGHSLAGFFTLEAMTRAPEAFTTYAAISPSIWWNEARLRAGIEHAARIAPRVFIGVGGWEDALPPWQPHDPALGERRAARRMIANARDHADALARAFGPGRVRYAEFPEEDHASVLNIAIVRALRFASGR